MNVTLTIEENKTYQAIISLFDFLIAPYRVDSIVSDYLENRLLRSSLEVFLYCAYFVQFIGTFNSVSSSISSDQ